MISFPLNGFIVAVDDNNDVFDNGFDPNFFSYWMHLLHPFKCCDKKITQNVSLSLIVEVLIRKKK